MRFRPALIVAGLMIIAGTGSYGVVSLLPPGALPIVAAAVNGPVSSDLVLPPSAEQKKHPIPPAIVQTTPPAASAVVQVTPAPNPTTLPAPKTTSGCHPLSSTGTCYEPGEFCSLAEHNETGLAGDGKTIKCENKNGWRWETLVSKVVVTHTSVSTSVSTSTTTSCPPSQSLSPTGCVTTTTITPPPTCTPPSIMVGTVCTPTDTTVTSPPPSLSSPPSSSPNPTTS